MIGGAIYQLLNVSSITSLVEQLNYGISPQENLFPRIIITEQSTPENFKDGYSIINHDVEINIFASKVKDGNGGFAEAANIADQIDLILNRYKGVSGGKTIQQIYLSNQEILFDSTSQDFTFTRASTGTRVNSDGYIEEVPWNELTYSEDFSSQWSKSNTTIIANDTISPRGLQDASKIYPNSSGNYRHIRNPFFSPSSGLFTFSIYAKAGELDHLVLIDYDGSGIGIDFDLTNGVATDNRCG